ncbi:MAG: YqiA/YcfP family alpha/beta fold hydrolase [Arcobacteraceae bacterium]
MVVYIHGFGSSAQGTKSVILKELFQEQGFIAPSLSYVPDLAIETLKDMISSYLKYENVYLVGSSLGGYYATYLANYFEIPAVLINPAVNAATTLSQAIGYAHNYYDNSTFEWNESHIKMLEKLNVLEIKDELYMLLAQTEDEVLNYKEAVDKFQNSQMFVEVGGNHSFEGIERHKENIERFFQL